MVDSEAGDDDVEGLVGLGDRLAAGDDNVDVGRRTVTRVVDERCRWVDTDDAAG